MSDSILPPVDWYLHLSGGSVVAGKDVYLMEIAHSSTCTRRILPLPDLEVFTRFPSITHDNLSGFVTNLPHWYLIAKSVIYSLKEERYYFLSFRVVYLLCYLLRKAREEEYKWASQLVSHFLLLHFSPHFNNCTKSRFREMQTGATVMLPHRLLLSKRATVRLFKISELSSCSTCIKELYPCLTKHQYSCVLSQ